jgi:proteasome lid subunit RPN8/RPN11
MPAIKLTAAIAEELVAASRKRAKEECCGLLAGRNGVITRVLPAENVASDPTKSYEIDPKETVRLMREMRGAGLEFLGIFHSHPNGENAPSPRDIELAYYTEEIYFVLSPRPGAPQPVRAFSIRGGRVTELAIEVVQERGTEDLADAQDHGGDVVILPAALSEPRGFVK